MIGQIFIDDWEIGSVDFKIIDESMGAIGGPFLAAEKYKVFKKLVQKQTEKNGNASSNDFNFKIIINGEKLNPIGGICLIDSKKFNEMYLDAAGLNIDYLKCNF